MGGRRSTTEAGDTVLDLRIERLEKEERDAVRRRDWSAARSTLLEKTALKKARHKTSARSKG